MGGFRHSSATWAKVELMISSGKTYLSVSEAFGISHNTIKTHMQRAHRNSPVRGRPRELPVARTRQDWVEVEPEPLPPIRTVPCIQPIGHSPLGPVCSWCGNMVREG